MKATVDTELVIWWVTEEDYEYYGDLLAKAIYMKYELPYFGSDESYE